MVVTVVVVGGFERGEGAVEEVAGGDFDGVHERLVTGVHAHHVGLNELVEARDFGGKWGQGSNSDKMSNDFLHEAQRLAEGIPAPRTPGGSSAMPAQSGLR